MALEVDEEHVVPLALARRSRLDAGHVDAVLGKAPSGWEGGARRIETDTRVSFGGPSVGTTRHLLLPVLHALHSRLGWISPGALNYASRRLGVPPAEAHGVASFYEMFSLEPRPPVRAYVCDDIACMAGGAEKLCRELDRTLGPRGTARASGKAGWQRSPCLGLCERAPAALITVAGERPQERVVAPATAERVVSAMAEAVDGKFSSVIDPSEVKSSVPQAGQGQLRLLRRVGQVDPTSLDDYRRSGGYEALRTALDGSPERIIAEVIEAKLLGRGGALHRLL